MKCCIKCNIEKDDGEFRSGRNTCKTCRREQKKQWYQNNTEARKEYKKQYYQNNAEAIKQYYQNNAEAIKQYRQNNLQKEMLRSARKRAKQKNIPFSITEENIVIPNVCPVLGIPLEAGIGKGFAQPNSPSLDRIIPSLGYVPENIRVISHRANTIKRDMTLEECALLFQDFKKRE